MSRAASVAQPDAVSTTAAGPAFGNACTRYGVAFPTVSAPTTVPIARPRRARNHVDAIFIAGGYTPASESPAGTRRIRATLHLSEITSGASAGAPASDAMAKKRPTPSALSHGAFSRR